MSTCQNFDQSETRFKLQGPVYRKLNKRNSRSKLEKNYWLTLGEIPYHLDNLSPRQTQAACLGFPVTLAECGRTMTWLPNFLRWIDNQIFILAMGSACTRIARAWSSAISCTLSNHELQKISKAEECRDSKLELSKLNQSGNSLYRPLQYGMYFFVLFAFSVLWT